MQHRAKLGPEEPCNDDHPQKPRKPAGNGGPRHPKGGQADGRNTIDEHGISADVDTVHHHRHHHGLLHQLTAPEKGCEGQIDRLEYHPEPDDPHIETRLIKDNRLHPHKPEHRAAEADQEQADRQSKDQIGRQRDRIDPVDLFGIPGADVLGDQDHGGGAYHRKDQQKQVCNLIGITDGTDAVWIVPTHHDLIGVAHHQLKQKLDKNRPGQGQDVIFAVHVPYTAWGGFHR